MTDIDEPRLSFVAESLNCPYHACDVVDESNILRLVNKANSELGHIDLFCSNAGIDFSRICKGISAALTVVSIIAFLRKTLS